MYNRVVLSAVIAFLAAHNGESIRCRSLSKSIHYLYVVHQVMQLHMYLFPISQHFSVHVLSLSRITSNASNPDFSNHFNKTGQ